MHRTCMTTEAMTTAHVDVFYVCVNQFAVKLNTDQ